QTPLERCLDQGGHEPAVTGQLDLASVDLLEQGIQLPGGLQLLDQILARGPIVMLLLLVRHGHDCSVPLGTAYTDHLTRPERPGRGAATVRSFGRALYFSLERTHQGLMRELLQNTINTLLSADADLVAGAEYGHASQTRSAQRNGYRHRELDTRVGTIDVAVPELRTGSYEAPRSAEELHCDAEQRHRHAAEAHADNDAPCSRVHQFRDAGEPVDRERRAEQQTEDEQGIHRVAARARRAGELVAHTRP